MLAKDAPHLFDRLGMALGRVAGADDFFRLHTIDMSAFVRHDTVGLPSDRAIAEHGNDRVGRDTRVDGEVI